MNRKTLRNFLCCILLIMLTLSAASCGSVSSDTHETSVTTVSDDKIPFTSYGNTEDLMVNIHASEADSMKSDDTFVSASASFSVELFKKCLNSKSGENTLVSPLSVMSALSMTANGAAGNTLTEMEDTLGLDIKSLNKYLNDYISALRSTGKFTLANSVWIRNDEDRIKVEKEFLQTLADYYGAQAFKSDFNEETVKAINGWISDNTDGMIKNMLEKIEVDNVMFLINALTFESEWADTEWSNIQPGKFTTEAGIELDAVMMGYDGEFNYIIDTEGGAKGIEKEYTGGQYSFVALLPDEGKSLSDYTASLTGERFVSLVKSAKKTNGIYQIPKFSFDYSVTLNDILSDMGMGGAFDSNGDFSKMASTDSEALYISNVIHNTFIKVDEKGTIAGAATIVSMSDECAPETVINLNRPFLFAIVDNSTGLPLFIGAVYQV